MKQALIVSVFAAAAAYAQTAPAAHVQAATAPLEFEVASVKPADPIADSVNIGVHVDGAQVHIADFSLADYIRIAYRLKNYQVTGPDTLSERFNVDAKLPEGASREQVADMLQTLLANRFEMKMHRETKEFPVYSLAVVTGGLKLKEVPPDKDDADPAGATRGGGTDVQVTGGRGGVNINYGHGSFFTFADNKLEAKKLTMTMFADLLARFVDRPVVDRTEMKGNYDIKIDLTQEDYMAMMIRSAIAAGVTLPPQALQLLNGASDESLHSALRNFGLKLEPTKAPLEVLVVDHISKTPVAN
jgi:uncharacterized protein (TIGR03435 family)